MGIKLSLAQFKNCAFFDPEQKVSHKNILDQSGRGYSMKGIDAKNWRYLMRFLTGEFAYSWISLCVRRRNAEKRNFPNCMKNCLFLRNNK